MEEMLIEVNGDVIDVSKIIAIENIKTRYGDLGRFNIMLTSGASITVEMSPKEFRTACIDLNEEERKDKAIAIRRGLVRTRERLINIWEFVLSGSKADDDFSKMIKLNIIL